MNDGITVTGEVTVAPFSGDAIATLVQPTGTGVGLAVGIGVGDAVWIGVGLGVGIAPKTVIVIGEAVPSPIGLTELDHRVMANL